MNHVIGIIREAESGFRLSFPDFPGLQADGDGGAAAAVQRSTDDL
ncbi:hypothetical protein [Xanthobacter aminoxidans]|nr:hypothetical protein [Xanthobacter aminoxidans]